MTAIFVIADDGSATPVTGVRCSDEERELQQLLAKNPELLPGEQIQPEDPCRWLLIRREMPVPDPSTGQDLWSIDHVFADQNAIPTLVECKRFADTRARREVVGQMLEYAANGQHYWAAEDLQSFAEDTAREAKQNLDEALTALNPAGDLSADEFFAAFVQNLREGRVRLVFFLEEAPFELKSIVEFLNRQMERAEVLIVEARQYVLDCRRLVTPSLFGFTEEARRVKRPAPGTRRTWTAETFMATAREGTSADELRAVERLLTFAQEQRFELSWGKGKTGSFSVAVPEICHRSLFSVFSNGKITWNFGWFQDDDRQRDFRNELADRLNAEFDADFPPNLEQRWPSLRPEKWVNHVGQLEAVLLEVIEEHRKAD